ncbi:esterase/lipase family protein [Sphingobium algorifonticola]|uniref:Alpha/beta fold hydrolase n=1 Tax=Sphingobium algorifonticola TaxID=2008318 RepID=A0A437J5G2_9SPHN|nr:alpha/beta fold hydrolase [Sphingobium algorifonticola]RVT39875.1 alpha/beta fold hydrolase [Sphingobium algorifonticola]
MPLPIAPDEGRAVPDGIVLLHGFGGHPIQTTLLARRLRQSGYYVANIGYPSWRWPIDRVIDHLYRRISASPVIDGRQLHFIGHSMGGLILRAYLAQHRPVNMGRVVMLGTPNGGSELADLLYRLRLHTLILNKAGDLLRTKRPDMIEAALGHIDYPLGIIAGESTFNGFLPNIVFGAPNDGKVSVAATHLLAQTDHLVLPVTHTAMIYARPVAQNIVHFLRHGRFHRPAA